MKTVWQITGVTRATEKCSKSKGSISHRAKRSNRDNVSIQVRNVGITIMVSREENCVREEFGSVDEYINC